MSPASFLRYDMTLCGDRYTVDLQIDNTYTLGSVDNRKYDIVLNPEQLRRPNDCICLMAICRGRLCLSQIITQEERRLPFWKMI